MRYSPLQNSLGMIHRSLMPPYLPSIETTHLSNRLAPMPRASGKLFGDLRFYEGAHHIIGLVPL